MSFVCEYCNKTFKRESTLVSHMCRDKKRWLQRNDQHVKLGFKFFNDWYRIAMGAKGEKDYKTFMKSQYYGAFVRFGLYVLEARVLAPERYLDWLIKEKTPVDNWCKDSAYNKYLAIQSKNETAERAVERFVIHADKWGQRGGRHWSEYWSTVSPYELVSDIKMGKVSPWVFLGNKTAKLRLESLPIEMLTDIANTVDIPFWQRKLDLNKPSVTWINEILNVSV